MVIRRLWGLGKRGASFMFGGIVDQIASNISRKQVTFGKAVAAKLHNCEPWTDHLYPETLASVNDALNDGNFRDARALIHIGKTEDANRYCIDMALLAVELLAAGIEEEIDFVSQIAIHRHSHG